MPKKKSFCHNDKRINFTFDTFASPKRDDVYSQMRMSYCERFVNQIDWLSIATAMKL